MRRIKYTLPFVNKGKEFVIPNWTVEKHETAIANTVEFTKENKELSDIQKENELKYYIIYETLIEIDKTVTVDQIREFFGHPDNLVEFFTAVYSAGKKEIYFRKEENPPRKKSSTLKKN
jgi:hypothetical protein